MLPLKSCDPNVFKEEEDSFTKGKILLNEMEDMISTIKMEINSLESKCNMFKNSSFCCEESFGKFPDSSRGFFLYCLL